MKSLLSFFLTLLLLISLSSCGTAEIPTATPAEPAPPVTGLAVASVYAHDLTYTATEALSHTTELAIGADVHPKYALPGSSNFHQALPITLSVPDGAYGNADITFEVTVTGGEFARPLNGEYGRFLFGPAYLGQHFTIENHQTICWWRRSTDVEHWEYEYDEKKISEGIYPSPDFILFEGVKAYADILIRADDRIVGCMTILIQLEDNTVIRDNAHYTTQNYYPKLLGSVSFPGSDVTAEQAQLVMDGWKAAEGDSISRTPVEDIILDQTSANLFDLTASLLIIENTEDVARIYRLHGALHVRYIELYETDPITDGAILNDAIPLRAATQNILNQYDYAFVYDRFYALYDEEKLTQAAHFSDLWKSDTEVWVLNTEDMTYVTGADAQDILDMIHTLYRDRGSNQLHEEFLPS